jgi:hypothetical protein
MQISVIVAFVVIFALVLACVGLGMKYFEARRKKHVTGMLQTVAGQPAVTISNILREEADPNQSVVQRACLGRPRSWRDSWPPVRLPAAP